MIYKIARCALFSFLFSFLGCGQQPIRTVHPAFYYWKTRLDLGQKDLDLFRHIGVEKLYVRFFDLSWNPKIKQPMPSDEIGITGSDLFPGKIVPVVYVTQDAIKLLDGNDVGNLASNILREVVNISKKMGISSVTEIQMDCDWTPSNRDKYFSLLAEIMKRKNLLSKSPIISATIRLHQAKYVEKNGVPPVDRGVLMVYHTTSPFVRSRKNSILDVDEAKSYLKKIEDYPLKLDVALPLFVWIVRFDRQGFFRHILNNPNLGELTNNMKIRKKADNIYEVLEDTFLGDQRLMEGDLLRLDEPKIGDCLKIRDYLRKRVKNREMDLIFFDYDVPSVDRITGGDHEKLKEFFSF